MKTGCFRGAVGRAARRSWAGGASQDAADDATADAGDPGTGAGAFAPRSCPDVAGTAKSLAGNAAWYAVAAVHRRPAHDLHWVESPEDYLPAFRVERYCGVITADM